MTNATTPDAATPDEATPNAAGPKKHAVWVWVSTFVCCAAMGVVIAMAVKGRQSDGATPEPWPDARTAGAAFGMPLGKDNPCGETDPDRPAAIEVDVPGTGRTLDFGVSQQGVQVTRELTFRSTGKGPLCIFNLKSGCGCFKVAMKKGQGRKFEPGQSGIVTVTMDSTGKIGQVKKSIRIFSNSIDTPIAKIRCRVDVRKGLLISRTRLFMPTVPTAMPTSATAVVQAMRSEPEWTVTKVAGTKKRPDGSLTPYAFQVTDSPDPKWRKRRITITHPGLDTPGLWQEPLVIYTTHPDRPQISIEIRMSAMNRILADKRSVSLGHVREGEAGEPVEIRFRAGEPSVSFSLTRAYVVPPADGRPGSGAGFMAKVGQDDRGWFVRVHYDGRKRAPGLLRGDMIVHTTDRLQGQIRLPIRATILPTAEDDAKPGGLVSKKGLQEGSKEGPKERR